MCVPVRGRFYISFFEALEAAVTEKRGKIHLPDPNLAISFLHDQKLASYADHGQHFPKNTPLTGAKNRLGVGAKEQRLGRIEGERERRQQ